MDDGKIKITSPRYQQIAADLAAKIANDHYSIGEKIYARSSIASQYSVSSETARRAIHVLSDMGIVETARGSGVTIKSKDNAVKFVKQYYDIKSINDIKKDIIEYLDQMDKDNKKLKRSVNELLDKTERFKDINPFNPFEIPITSNSKYTGMNISEINFWHNTGATIIAIKKNDVLLLSPGPYATLDVGNILYYIGDENSKIRVENFLYDN